MQTKLHRDSNPSNLGGKLGHFLCAGMHIQFKLVVVDSLGLFEVDPLFCRVMCLPKDRFGLLVVSMCWSWSRSCRPCRSDGVVWPVICLSGQVSIAFKIEDCQTWAGCAVELQWIGLRLKR